MLTGIFFIAAAVLHCFKAVGLKANVDWTSFAWMAFCIAFAIQFFSVGR